MPAAIVVEVYAPQPRAEELSVLISACSRAAAPVECITSEARGSEPPLGVAIVRRDGDKARIELGLRGVAGAEWTTRDLLFQPGDDELERYRTLGFAIGTLAAGKREPREAAPAPTPASATNSPALSAKSSAKQPHDSPLPTASAGAPKRVRSTWLDLSGGLGVGLVPGPPRAIGSLRAASELAASGLFGVAETSYAERLSDPTLAVSWLSLSLGIGYGLRPHARPLGVDVRLQASFEHLSFSARSEQRSDGATRWKPGLLAAADAHWQALPPVGFVLSVSGLLDPRRSIVKVAGTQLASTPTFGLNGFVGLRFKLR